MVVTERKIKKEIRNAGIAGIILTVLTVFGSFSPTCIVTNPLTSLGFLACIGWGTEALGDLIPNFAFVPGVIILNVVSVLLLVGLTYGVFKKSQWYAILLFVGIYVLPTMPVYLVFIFFFFQGMMGTFAFHKSAEKQK